MTLGADDHAVTRDDVAVGPVGGEGAAGVVAVAEHDDRPSARWWFLLLYFLAFTGIWIALLAPILLTLSLRLNALVGTVQAAGALGAIVAIGALLVIVSNPVFGRLSDRTTSRFGMRRPWIVGGYLGGAVAACIMAFAPSVFLLGVGFAFSQFSFSAATAALYGVLADQIPERQRGLVSGIVGSAIPAALPIAALIVTIAAPDIPLMFLAPMLVGILPVLVFVLVLKDRRLGRAERPAFAWRALPGSFWVNPIRHRDFGLAWWGRFFFVLAYGFLSTYQAFFLITVLREPPAGIPALITTSTLILSACTLVTALVGGRVSDALQRRKVFVVAAAVLYGGGLFIIATAPEFDRFLIGVAVSGLGFGLWAAVDTALFVDVLPSAATAGKDLAVANVANTLPQSLAPAIAPVILLVAAGSYPVLYTVAAACAVFSALFIFPIRSVR